MSGGETGIHSDEPTVQDKLNRTKYAEAFARITCVCKTPMVIGLYGSWGVGKTSLMKLIESKLDPSKTRAIWFNVWENQFNENPVVGLAQSIAESTGRRIEREAKKFLTIIAAAFGNKMVKSLFDFDVFDFLKLGKTYEDENFQTRDFHLHLKDHFKSLAAVAMKAEGGPPKRLVFFIDDLDRCLPGKALELLEALKLYLNIEGCIYFIGVDRAALEITVSRSYGSQGITERDYLEKIIQLPFTIPLIEPTSMETFIEPMLSDELQGCRKMLVEGLGDNPRQVKRFINTLSFNHELARSMDIPEYNPEVLALLLLFQALKPELYRRICSEPQLMVGIREGSEEGKKLIGEFIEKEPRLSRALKQVDLKFLDAGKVKYYIYLTQVSFSEELVVDLGPIGPGDKHILKDRYVLWVDDRGLEGTEGIERELQRLGVSLTVVNSTEAAERRIKERKPDILVSDIGRGQDYNAGFEMAEKFQKDGLFRGPYYFYAGDAGHGRIDRAARIGATIFVERAPLINELKMVLAMMNPKSGKTKK